MKNEMKKLLLILPLLFWLGCANLFIEIDGQRYIKNVPALKDGLYYYQTVNFDNGVFSGEISDKLYSGYYQDKMTAGSFKDGKLHGKWIYRHKNGQIASEGMYKNGEQDGLWTNWSPNGKENTEIMFKDGQPYNGEISTWYENGQKNVQATYKDGNKIGKWTSWHSNGQKMAEGINNKDGTRDGVWIFWHPNGQKWFEETYMGGDVINRHLWDKEGNQIDQLVDQYYFKAKELDRQGRYLEAARMYEKSVEAERKSPKQRLSDLQVLKSMTGHAYYKAGQYEKAIDYYEQVLEFAIKLFMQDTAYGKMPPDSLYDNEGELVNWYSTNSDGGEFFDNETNFTGEPAPVKLVKVLTPEGSKRMLNVANTTESMNLIGLAYDNWGQYGKAIDYYEQALEIDKRLGDKENIARDLNNIGGFYHSTSQYDAAIKYYEEALAIARKLKFGQEALVATSLNNIGMVYRSWGQYDKAIKYFEESLAIDKRWGRENTMAISIASIGSVYHLWGQPDKAITHYNEALEILKKPGRDMRKLPMLLSYIGNVYNDLGQYDKAITHYNEALEISKKLSLVPEVASISGSIAAYYISQRQYEKALPHLEKSGDMYRKLSDRRGLAESRNSLGSVYLQWGEYDQALELYESALILAETSGMEPDIAAYRSNIGMVHYELKNYIKAIENFNASVGIYEKLRKTATGDVRRDYFASQIGTYELLVSSYLRNNDLPNAFSTIELSRAKLLTERLARTELDISVPTLKEIQRNISEDTAILTYANVGHSKKIAIAITSDNIYGIELSDKEFMTSAREKYETPVNHTLKNLRGIKKVKKDRKEKKSNGKIDFNDIINYYRNLLADPFSEINNEYLFSKGNKSNLDQMLYDFLVKPLAEHIKHKENLIIIPDGVLGLLPFETLKDSNGIYLIEKFNIMYAQSMGVLNIIKERNYSAGREPLLAFGGAVYDEIQYSPDMINTEKQLTFLEKKLYTSFENQRSVRNAYASLGVSSWDNLPGTLSEVNNITKIVPGTKIYTGNQVTENNVKKLSDNGELANYKVIHFATHGLVVPEIPELSAIVLSQFKFEQAGEDGYLRMAEIARLNLKADFVNLSACETGLGKIYGGEGVVGLTQSFLIAGANGLSVSLWQVADESTSKFMIAMYKSVQEQEIGYRKAINDTKLRFINGEFGDKYKGPFYWAPFVYYGE